MNLLLPQFHKDLKNKLNRLYETELVEYCKLVKEAEEKIKKFILDEFNNTVKLQDYRNNPSFNNVAEVWKNFLLGKYEEHFYLEQFNITKDLTNIKIRNFRGFFDFVREQNKEIISSACKQQQKVINLINEITNLFNEKLTPSKIEKLSKRQFDILLVFLVGFLTLCSAFGGAGFTYWLTKDPSPQIFVNFDLVELKRLEVVLTNGKDNVAADIKIKTVPQINPAIYYHQIDTLEKGKKEIISFDIDSYYLMKESIKNNKTFEFVETQTIQITDLCSDITVTFKGYKESDIIYIDKRACFSIRCRLKPLIPELKDAISHGSILDFENPEYCFVNSGSYD